MLVIRSVREEDELWALDQALRCRGVGAVYAPLTRLDVHDFRRLQLAAECGGTLGLFLRPATVRGDPSWADLQLAVCPRGSPAGRKLCVEIIRCRGGTAGRSLELEITNSGMVQTVSMSHASRETHSLSPVAELARAKIADFGLRIAE
jgi:protein ImuA